MVANLVLLDRDPPQELHNTQRIHAGIVNGRLLDHKALDAILTRARESH